MLSHNLNTRVGVLVRDEKGRIIEQENKINISKAPSSIRAVTQDINIEVPFRSFLKNFMYLMFGCGFAQEYHYLYEYYYGSNTQFGTNINGDFLNMISAAGRDVEGPVIGTSPSSNTASQWNLNARIANSSGFTHGTVAHSALTSTGSGYKFETTRDFTNSTGGAVTIGEIGLVADVDSGDPLLLARDGGLSINVNNGQVLTTTHKFEISNSDGWVSNWLTMILAGFTETGISYKPINYDRDNLMGTIYGDNYYIWGMGGGTGYQNVGIVIGDSSTATDCDHYCLQNQINHGTSAGQLYHHSNANYSAPANSGSDWSWVMTRAFTNTTDSPITVSEFAVYLNGVHNSINYSEDTWKIMVYRNLIGPHSVPVNGSIEIYIDFVITV